MRDRIEPHFNIGGTPKAPIDLRAESSASGEVTQIPKRNGTRVRELGQFTLLMMGLVGGSMLIFHSLAKSNEDRLRQCLIDSANYYSTGHGATGVEIADNFRQKVNSKLVVTKKTPTEPPYPLGYQYEFTVNGVPGAWWICED